MSGSESGFVANRQGEDLFVQLMHGDSGRLWIFCPPLLEEAMFCRASYQELALSLHAQGDGIIQFDYAGTGDSTGSMQQISLDSLVRDAADLMTWTGHDPAATTAYGLRLGANVALRLAAQHPGMRALAWLPLDDGAQYLDSLLRYNLVTQLAAWSEVREKRDDLHARLARGESVNVLGFTLPPGLTASLRDYRLAGEADTLPPGLLLLSKSAESKVLVRRLARPGFEVREVQVKPFWHEPKQLDGVQSVLVGLSQSHLSAEQCV